MVVGRFRKTTEEAAPVRYASARANGAPPAVSGLRGRQAPRDRLRGSAAHGMAEATGADTFLLTGLRRNVVDDIVGAARVAAHACRDMIQAERSARSPGDIVV